MICCNTQLAIDLSILVMVLSDREEKDGVLFFQHKKCKAKQNIRYYNQETVLMGKWELPPDKEQTIYGIF